MPDKIAAIDDRSGRDAAAKRSRQAPRTQPSRALVAGLRPARL